MRATDIFFVLKICKVLEKYEEYARIGSAFKYLVTIKNK